jgi:CheY-like chemotaxis protein
MPLPARGSRLIWCEASGRDILVVDDTPANLRLLAQMLAERAFKVWAVTGGARSPAALQSTPSDLVLLDIKMPGMNGYEVCERLKADAQKRDIPVIFISSLDEVAGKVNASSTGGVDHIPKPFQLDEVLASETHQTSRDLQRRLQDASRRLEGSWLWRDGVRPASCRTACWMSPAGSCR